MKLSRVFVSVAVAIVAAIVSPALSVTCSAADRNAQPFSVPEVREWQGREGSLVLGSDVRIAVSDASLDDVARQLAANFAFLTGHTPEIITGKGRKGDIVLSLGKATKGSKTDKGRADTAAEVYTVVIDDKVTITATAPEGVRWGCMTLLQLTETSPQLPKGRITDFPQWGFRGLVLDAGRKYIPLDYLYKLVEVMAYYKMNVLHVHLNDNGFKYFYDDDWDKTQAAFRMECDTYPGLTARDGHYTKAEFRDFQKYAASRGVEIIPEIDFPAHSLAFTRYMPELAPTDSANDADHLNLDNPATYTFLDNLLKEYLEGDDPVFSGGRFHIGTDEYQGDSTAMEQFRALTDRYIRYTRSFGKQPLVWGSLTHAKGTTPVATEGVLMYLWSNDYARPMDMLELGYDVVSIPDRDVYIVPAAGYYHDYLDLPKLYDRWTPANVNGVDIGEDNAQLKGGLFAVWNDHPGNGVTVKDIHHRIMHALPVLATKMWDGSRLTVPFERFMEATASLSEAPGVNYLGRHAATDDSGTVYALETLNPGDKLPLDEIGYDYTVEFDIEGYEETPGTVLFDNGEATFWLSDPITGNIGFSREGQLSSFRYAVTPGTKARITVTGDNMGTRLYVDGKLVDNLSRRWVRYGDSNRRMALTSTLVFPLDRTGDFKSRLSNLRVYNRALPDGANRSR